MANINDITVDIYERSEIKDEELLQRHAFHVVIIYEHKMLSFFQKRNKKQKLFDAALNYFKKSEKVKSNILKYDGLNGNILIRFPYKSSKRPTESKEMLFTNKEALIILNRISNNKGKIRWITDLDDDLVWDNREFSKRLGDYYEKLHFEEKKLEILEQSGKQALTEAEMVKARYELGEKEFERRLRENIPIVVK